MYSNFNYRVHVGLTFDCIKSGQTLQVGCGPLSAPQPTCFALIQVFSFLLYSVLFSYLFVLGDSFIFWNFVRTSFTVWHGRGSPQSTRTYALAVADLLKTSCLPTSHNRSQYAVKEVEEGKENYEFWQHAGLAGEKNTQNAAQVTHTHAYASEAWLRDPARKAPRMFVCHEDLFSGQFLVTHSQHICQSLLSNNDVIILDVFSVVFVWCGSRSSAYKKEMGMKTATAYPPYSSLTLSLYSSYNLLT
jgi:hypothetical protein